MSDVFSYAVKETVSTTLDVPVNAITEVTVKGNRRVLLSGVAISYVLSITSGRSAESFMTMLNESVISHSFATSLSRNSGLAITGVSGLRFVNYSPTTSPTDTPVIAAGQDAMCVALLCRTLFCCVILCSVLFYFVLFYPALFYRERGTLLLQSLKLESYEN